MHTIPPFVMAEVPDSTSVDLACRRQVVPETIVRVPNPGSRPTNKLSTLVSTKRANSPTDRDVDVLRYIARTLQGNSRGPSLRDICREFDFVSITQAVRAVNSLCRAGRLKRGLCGFELVDSA
jgi:hypothetical protein